MDIKTEKHDKQLTVALSGRLDTATAPLLDTRLHSEISDVNTLVFDLTALEYISSAGLRVLLNAQKIMNRQGTMSLQHIHPSVREVLEVTGFSSILSIEP